MRGVRSGKVFTSDTFWGSMATPSGEMTYPRKMVELRWKAHFPNMQKMLVWEKKLQGRSDVVDLIYLSCGVHKVSSL